MTATEMLTEMSARSPCSSACCPAEALRVLPWQIGTTITPAPRYHLRVASTLALFNVAVAAKWLAEHGFRKKLPLEV